MRVRDLLRTVDLFSRVSSEDLDQLGRRMHERTVRAEEVVFQQAEPAEAICVVASGTLQLTQVAPDGRVRSTRRVTEGESLGEVAVFADEAYSFTARALTDSGLLVLPKQEFDALVASRPSLMRHMLAAISQRAIDTNRELVNDEPGATSIPAIGQVYCIFSPRSSAGKTTLAVNIALRLTELLPGRVALVDLDLLFDDAALLLNLSPARSLANLPEGDFERLDRHRLATYLVEHDTGLRVLVGATRPEDGERVTAAHVRAALTAMKRQFPITVVDCDNSLGEPTLVALETANRVAMVCTPELSTLRDVRDCQRIFGQALHLDTRKISYWFNHPLPFVGLTRKQFESALEQSISFEIPHAGESAAKTAAASGSVVRPSGHSPFGRAIERIARDLQPHQARVDSPARSSSADLVPRPISGRERLARLLRRPARG